MQSPLLGCRRLRLSKALRELHLVFCLWEVLLFRCLCLLPLLALLISSCCFVVVVVLIIQRSYEIRLEAIYAGSSCYLGLPKPDVGLGGART